MITSNEEEGKTTTTTHGVKRLMRMQDYRLEHKCRQQFVDLDIEIYIYKKPASTVDMIIDMKMEKRERSLRHVERASERLDCT